ncbi:MAG: hypothetical protein K5790_02430 [Nitrosopumilus sp.]|uniref:hypothetical protein n=1 Tax=Nitrosopumilus sp. TaxID=2024843 RepID=UPI00247DB0C1|nr:hypothetical protein [Nitrosopumilus sp.]MCV0392132.1 hypothetical protein [Nitrosopumilus sp.]
MSQYEPRKNQHERERILFQTIKDNPELHHNLLIKKIVPEFMAKTTFEKTRDALLQKEIILVEKKGNMKFYRLSENYELNSQHHIERDTHNTFHDLKMKIKKIDTDFSHKDIDEKISFASRLLYDLILVDNGFTVLDSIKNPNKTLYRDEHLTIQQLIFHVFEIIRKDKDSQILFPAIFSNVGTILPKPSFET